MHQYQDLIVLFNSLFQQSEQTILVKGEAEPLYLPRSEDCPYHQIIFAHGFYQSALHEIAHWCIAGKERRTLVDYGYWYQPDGRTAKQQAVFESVESKPQALEWLFSLAAGSCFYISIDNLSGEGTDPASFKAKVYNQALYYLQNGLPLHAHLFQQALHKHYATSAIAPPQLLLDSI